LHIGDTRGKHLPNATALPHPFGIDFYTNRKATGDGGPEWIFVPEKESQEILETMQKVIYWTVLLDPFFLKEKRRLSIQVLGLSWKGRETITPTCNTQQDREIKGICPRFNALRKGSFVRYLAILRDLFDRFSCDLCDTNETKDSLVSYGEAYLTIARTVFW
jgi:hypothetical protein